MLHYICHSVTSRIVLIDYPLVLEEPFTVYNNCVADISDQVEQEGCTLWNEGTLYKGAVGYTLRFLYRIYHNRTFRTCYIATNLYHRHKTSW